MLEREAESAAGGAEPSPTDKEPVIKREGEGVSTRGRGRSPGIGAKRVTYCGNLRVTV